MELEKMHLKILLPFMVFTDVSDVKNIIIETPDGSYGYLPNRLDSVAIIAPGILSYESEKEGQVFIAVDDGVFIKAGGQIFVSVRNAIRGTDLGKLHRITEEEFLKMDEREKNFRDMLLKLENNFIRQFTQFQKGIKE